MKTKNLEILFLTMMLGFLISSIISMNTTKETTIIHSDSEKDFSIISADYWEILTTIWIDDSSPGSNWAFTNATNSWCNGAGTWEDPYVIENVTINPGSGSAIIIENSNVYFIIRNCTIRNTGGSSEDAGIKLINVNNSRILGNKFFDIDRIGIYLKNSCTNNTISDNYLFEDSSYISFYMKDGIYLNNQCSNNTIKNNELYGIGRFDSYDRGGIHLKNNCSFNKIENNQVNRSMHGIFLNGDCNENTLFNNSLINNDGNGIFISTNCDLNLILNNTVYENDNGIYFEVSCNINVVANNTVYNNDENGIHFINGCEYNVIVNNTIYENDVGIKVETDLQFCKYYTIAGNILNKNLLYGIYLDTVINVELYENQLYGCGFLIDSNNINHHRSISLSTNNTVNGKPVYYIVEESGLDSSDFPNAGQIILIDCNNTNLENFEFSSCSIGIYIYATFYWGTGSFNHIISNISLQENTIGIYIERIHNISISNVSAKKNSAGIYLGESDNSTIDNCTLNENSNYGLNMWESHYNNITNNYIRFNSGYGAGFYLGGCEFNKIINNTISNNAENGIYFNGGKSNYICGNFISYNNKSGISLWSSNCDYHTIINNTLSYNKEQGIYLYQNCNYNNITDNNIYNNTINGIYLRLNCNYNNITLNEIYNNTENGICLDDNCNYNNITLNQIYTNRDNGILIKTTSINNYIFNNFIIKNLQNGIYVKNSNNNNITENTINNHRQFGIYIDSCITISLSKNNFNFCGLYITGYLTQHYNSHQIDITNEVNNKKLSYYTNQFGLNIDSSIDPGQIILINCSDSIISNVNTSNGSIGIMLFLCENTTITDTYGTFNNLFGIYLKDSENCTLTSNTIIYNNQDGVYIEYDCYNINFTGNDIKYNLKNGIHLLAPNCLIDHNEIGNNGDNGIYISWASSINITSNTIEYNTNDGIYTISWSDYLLISNNSLSNNGRNGFSSNDVCNFNKLTLNQIRNNQENGIYLLSAYTFNISDNEIHTNSQNGILFDYASYCQIWNNTFINNGINAIDNGNSNSWDNGSIGNYWDDYTGGDNNGDGIGDTPYNVPGTAGSQDNYPIWGKLALLDDGGGSSGQKDKKTPTEINMFLMILGGVIIGSMIVAYYALNVISNKYTSKTGKKKVKDEPLLKPLQEEKDQSAAKPLIVKTSQASKVSSIKEEEIGLKTGMDEFDQFFIQPQLVKFASTFKKIYEAILRENLIIREYLESNVSVDDIPNGEKLITTIISDEELRKIERINLSTEEKKIFLMEVLSINTKDRKKLLDAMIINS